MFLNNVTVSCSLNLYGIVKYRFCNYGQIFNVVFTQNGNEGKHNKQKNYGIGTKQVTQNRLENI